MKILPNNAQSTSHIHAKSTHNRVKSAENTVAIEVSPRVTPTSSQGASANAASPHGRKDVPPGLQRVLDRLQSTSSDDLSRGQSNAASMISRNISRYLEVQAMAEPQSASPTEPQVPAPVAESPLPVTPVEETPTETISESAIEAA